MVSPEAAAQALVAHLIALGMWSLIVVVAGGVALMFRPRGFRHGFAAMSVGWCLVNLAIAAGGLANPAVSSVAQLREFLMLNQGLNVGYCAVGLTLVLALPEKPFARGCGWAVVVQGLVLLVLDGRLLSRL